MARPVWSGTLTFGLVSLPVQMYTATDNHTVRFHQLQRGTSDRVRNKRVNERTGEEVPLDEVVKAFDDGDEYVLVEPEELDDIAPGRSKTLEITGFVELEDVEPIFFDKTYYLGPKGKEYTKVYALLEKALGEAGRAGIATFVMRNHQYLVAVKAEDGLLTLHTLHWADEIRDPRREIDNLPGKIEVTDRELKMARQLVDTLGMEWKPEDFHDTYQEQVTALIEAKRTGESVEKAEPPAESTNVVDLMDALRASVDRAKKPSGRGGKQSSKAPTKISDAAAKRRAKGTGRRKGGARASSLDSLTKAELYQRAADAEVPGRSSMNRDELIEALRGARQHRATS
ncbi:Ku protein [Streptomyces kunmingensis]|uniref:Non-homologous end joining protein Ku n=1 Tax=Streptomyces kunmingensis TaxID=68225 RepID=A0ABU6CA01_9ACTN|nr:Ku protein [Streptomyces kunmingensis]MEB3961533.1 Ku protein [Streptomyces kunmingensis]